MAIASQEQVEKRIMDALVEFGAEPEDLRPEALLEEIDIDSLDLFEISQILKREFGILVDQDDFEGIHTLGDAQRVLLGYLK